MEAELRLASPLFLLCALFALLAGDWLTARIAILRELCIPRPVTGGLLASAVVSLLASLFSFDIHFDGALGGDLWRVLFSASEESPPLELDQPFLIAFFTAVGLGCSVSAIRSSGRAGLGLFAASSVLAAAQAVVGIAGAISAGQPAALGLACGSVSMTGGHGTTAGFAELLTAAGLPDARAIGFVAATFGLVIGGVVAGPIGSFLIRRYRVKPSPDAVSATRLAPSGGSLFRDLSALYRERVGTIALILILMVCFKVGAWLSHALVQAGLVFPIYMGSMIVGAIARNLLDSLRFTAIEEPLKPVRSLSIGIFLVLALMDTSFAALSEVVSVIGVLLLAQVALAIAFVAVVTYRWAGRDYDAAMISAGHCGIALGATPNALAAMEAIARRHGRVFQPFLSVSVVGGFFLDFSNALVILVAINWIR